MLYRCRSYRKRFSVRIGTVLRDFKLSHHVWEMTICVLDTVIRGESSVKLRHSPDITQKTAWRLAHRVRKSPDVELGEFTGPVKLDETYIGGKEMNRCESKKLPTVRDTVGKTLVVGAKNHESRQVQVQMVTDTIAETLTGFVYSTSCQVAQMIHADDASVSGSGESHSLYGKELGQGIHQRNGSYQRHGILSAAVEAWVFRHVSQNVTRTSTALRR